MCIFYSPVLAYVTPFLYSSKIDYLFYRWSMNDGTFCGYYPGRAGRIAILTIQPVNQPSKGVRKVSNINISLDNACSLLTLIFTEHIYLPISWTFNLSTWEAGAAATAAAVAAAAGGWAAPRAVMSSTLPLACCKMEMACWWDMFESRT